ncbi:hypothetical protein Tco_0581976 [Tanacetum coccineum]
MEDPVGTNLGPKAEKGPPALEDSEPKIVQLSNRLLCLVLCSVEETRKPISERDERHEINVWSRGDNAIPFVDEQRWVSQGFAKTESRRNVAKFQYHAQRCLLEPGSEIFEEDKVLWKIRMLNMGSGEGVGEESDEFDSEVVEDVERDGDEDEVVEEVV